MSRNENGNIFIHYLCSKCNESTKTLINNFKNKLVYGCNKCNPGLINSITKTSLYLKEVKKLNLPPNYSKKQSISNQINFEEIRQIELESNNKQKEINRLKKEQEKGLLKNELNKQREINRLKKEQEKGLFQKLEVELNNKIKFDIETKLKSFNFKLHSENLKTAKTKSSFVISCEFNHKTKINGNQISDNYVCKKCDHSKSFGEDLLRNMVEYYYGVEFISVRPNWLIGKRNKLELDLYNEDLKIAFEFNGPTHYEPIYGLNRLNSQLRNDKLKKEICFENGVTLYSIKDLWGSTRTIELLFEHIKNQLNNIGIEINGGYNLYQKEITKSKLDKLKQILRTKNKEFIAVIKSEAHFNKSIFLVRCLNCLVERTISGGTIKNLSLNSEFKACCPHCVRDFDYENKIKNILSKNNYELIEIINPNSIATKRKFKVKCLKCLHVCNYSYTTLSRIKINNKCVKC